MPPALCQHERQNKISTIFGLHFNPTEAAPAWREKHDWLPKHPGLGAFASLEERSRQRNRITCWLRVRSAATSWSNNRPRFHGLGAMTTSQASSGTAVSVAPYRADPLYPRIARAVDALLARGKVVAPVDVLLAMDYLTADRLEAWRRGQVPYLERVVTCNLTRLSWLPRILRFIAHDVNLKPSSTVYVHRGKGGVLRLRFTKSGDAKIEQAYSTHFVWPGKSPFHRPASQELPK